MTKQEQVRDLSLEDIKSFDDSYWLRYLNENTIFDTENIRTHKEWLINQVEAEKERADIAELDRDRNYMWYRRANEKLQAAEAREKKLREAIEETINEALTLDDATAFLNSVLVSLYPKEEETKKYTFKAILHIYNGIRTTVNGEQLTIRSQSAEQAEKELRESIESKYKHSSHLLLSNLQLELVEEEEAK